MSKEKLKSTPCIDIEVVSENKDENTMQLLVDYFENSGFKVKRVENPNTCKSADDGEGNTMINKNDIYKAVYDEIKDVSDWCYEKDVTGREVGNYLDGIVAIAQNLLKKTENEDGK